MARGSRTVVGATWLTGVALGLGGFGRTGPVAAQPAPIRDYSAPPGAPYRAIEVTVPTPAGHTLAGTLTLPAGAGTGHRVAALVSITGSGPQDRDEALRMLPGYALFREIADTLARRGVALLRLDDRGVGGSGGNSATATTEDFADDTRAALAWLRTRPEVDPGRLGLIGHSEGGAVAPMVAATDASLRGIVLLAGLGRPARRVFESQQHYAVEHDSTIPAAARDSAFRARMALVDSLGNAQPWMRFILRYDPLATARRVRTPVLLINGATDQQVTPDQQPELAAAFRAAGNRDVTEVLVPDANHLLVADPVGSPFGYSKLPSARVLPVVLGRIVDWVVARF